MELYLFARPQNTAESTRVELQRTEDIWHAHLPDVRPGQTYNYQVHNPHTPTLGHRFNPAKLLLDPYAKTINDTMQWSDTLSGYPLRSADPDHDLIPDPHDNAGTIPKGLIIDTAYA